MIAQHKPDTRTPAEERRRHKQMLQDRRRAEFLEAALVYFNVSKMFACRRQVDDEDPGGDRLAEMLGAAEREFMRAGGLAVRGWQHEHQLMKQAEELVELYRKGDGHEAA